MKAQFEKPNCQPLFWARLLKWEGKNVEQTTTYHLFAEDYKVKNIKFTDAAIEKIITSYTKEAGARDLYRQIDSVIRKVIISRDKNIKAFKYQLVGYEGFISVMPFYVPQSANSYEEFVDLIDN